jgi:hypothetical protein
MKYENDVLFIGRKHYKNYIPPAEINQFRETLFKNKNQPRTTIFKEKISIEKRGIVYAIKIENATVPFLSSQKLSEYYATIVGKNAKLCFPLATSANKISPFISTQSYFQAIIESQVVEPDIPVGDFVLSVGKLENQTFTVLKQLTIHVE